MSAAVPGGNPAPPGTTALRARSATTAAATAGAATKAHTAAFAAPAGELLG